MHAQRTYEAIEASVVLVGRIHQFQFIPEGDQEWRMDVLDDCVIYPPFVRVKRNRAW